MSIQIKNRFPIPFSRPEHINAKGKTSDSVHTVFFNYNCTFPAWLLALQQRIMQLLLIIFFQVIQTEKTLNLLLSSGLIGLPLISGKFQRRYEFSCNVFINHVQEIRYAKFCHVPLLKDSRSFLFSSDCFHEPVAAWLLNCCEGFSHHILPLDSPYSNPLYKIFLQKRIN